MAHSSVTETIQELRSRFPSAPFLALGQTVFWDEPVKAAWRELLDEHWPDARLIAGVHDTDYFAKTTALVPTDEPYAILAHDDGATRGLWSAAGELSAFLGSEDIPTRALYERYAIPFNMLAAANPEGKARFYEDHTEAWGWRAIVATGANPPIAGDVPLSEFGPVLLQQLDWGFELSLQVIDAADRQTAQAPLTELRGWVSGYLDAAPPTATLADLYRDLLPKFYAKTLGREPALTEFTQTSTLLLFNRQTAGLPRFAFVDNFLSPSLRDAACDAYNASVAGGGMYGLEHFGKDALPFDVVAPGHGRGTLRITRSAVAIDFHDSPLEIPAATPTNVAGLAAVLENALGENVVLVGKAVSLIAMLAGEFILLFHETASAYTMRTAAMNEKILAAGGAAPDHPIVRIAYPTWDALAAAGIETRLALPTHLARAFGATRAVPAKEFGARWHEVVAGQKERLSQVAQASSVRETIDLIETADDACWPCVRDQYERALSEVAANFEQTAMARDEMRRMRDHVAELTQLRERLEGAKGEHFRQTIVPLRLRAAEPGPGDDPDAVRIELTVELTARQTQYTDKIEAIAGDVRAARRRIKTLRAQMRAVERSPKALASRKVVTDLTRQAQMARLSRVRDAILTTLSLPHTNARPSAWWLWMVDPSGAWFRQIVDGAQVRLEKI